MFNVEQWLKEQESIQIFQMGDVIAKIMPLKEQDIEEIEGMTSYEDVINFASDCGLVLNGAPYVEQGSAETLDALWKMSKLPDGFREALALKVLELSGAELPADKTAEELAQESREINV